MTVTRDLFDPIFFPSNYQSRIDQNVPVGTSVMTVSASDADEAVRNFHGVMNLTFAKLYDTASYSHLHSVVQLLLN